MVLYQIFRNAILHLADHLEYLCFLYLLYFHISCFPDGPPEGANKIESSVPPPGRQYLKCCISTFYFSNLDKRSDSMGHRNLFKFAA